MLQQEDQHGTPGRLYRWSLTELVPRTCRSGSLDSSSLATMCRKLSTKGLMLWEWHAISSWSRASMAITTYLHHHRHVHLRSCLQHHLHHLTLVKAVLLQPGWDRRGFSPVAMAQHVVAQPLGEVLSDPVQLLRSRHGVEGQLLHV